MAGGSAGAHASERYRRLRRQWRRSHAKLFLVVGLICSLVIIGTYIAARPWPATPWLLGALAGAAATFFLAAWDTPPEWVENWSVGAWGEKATGRKLARLESLGWVVMHDVDTRRGNIDHIVIGPTGAVLLETKRLAGRVRVDGGVVRVQRIQEPELGYVHGGTQRVRLLAAQTSDRVRTVARIRQWVTPVMVVWADFPQRHVEGDCNVVAGDDLVEWLTSRPAQLSPAHVTRVADAVRAAWAQTPEPLSL